jgi:hypothetical protein
MASNTVLDAGAGGDTVVTKERTHDGDASKQQGVFLSGVSGSEGAYTFVDVDAGGGVEAAALRVTIASDSTGVLSVDDNGASLTVDNAGLTELAAAINASSQVDVNIAASGATVPVSHAALTELAAAINASSQLDVNVAAGGLTARAEDAAHVSGHEGVVMLAVRRDAAAVGSDTDGDYSTINVNASGRVYTSTTVDAALPAGTNNIGDVDVLSIAAGDNNIGNVDVVTLPNVTLAAGTNTNEVVGDAADDAATAGNPVLIGGVAVETDGTDPTTVSAEGDAAYLRTDRSRNLLVNITHPRFWHVSADYGAAQTNASVKAAPGAGLSLYVTDLVLSNGATAGNITLLDGSGGTVLFKLYPAINGGVSLNLRNPIKLTANTALCITSTTVTTHSIFVSGYIAP